MLTIIKAEQSHIKTIVSISKSLLQSNENSANKGFLIRELKEEVVAQHLNEFYVALLEDEIAGYIWVNDKYPTTRLANSTFNQEIDINNTIYVKQVATNPKFNRKGIATRLYHFIFELNSSKDVIACVATHPIKNEPSIIYHEKLGFVNAGELTLIDYLGFSTYKAIIFFYKNNK